MEDNRFVGRSGLVVVVCCVLASLLALLMSLVGMLLFPSVQDILLSQSNASPGLVNLISIGVSLGAVIPVVALIRFAVWAFKSRSGINIQASAKMLAFQSRLWLVQAIYVLAVPMIVGVTTDIGSGPTSYAALAGSIFSGLVSALFYFLRLQLPGR